MQETGYSDNTMPGLMEEPEYGDKTILELRALYRESQGEMEMAGDEVWIGSSLVPTGRIQLPGDKYSIILPENMEEMPEEEKALRYWNKNRPPVIRTTPDRTAAITFDWYTEDKPVDTSATERLTQLRQDMEKVWKKNVFYDVGTVQAGEIQVAWMDYKAFGMGGSFYGMTFLFKQGGEVVIGNFHCRFEIYDIWKPVLLQLFATIQKDERKEV